MKAKQLVKSFSLLGEYITAIQIAPSHQKVYGECVYESKNMLYLRTYAGRLIKLPKDSFSFVLDDGTSIDGKALLGRLVDRLVS